MVELPELPRSLQFLSSAPPPDLSIRRAPHHHPQNVIQTHLHHIHNLLIDPNPTHHPPHPIHPNRAPPPNPILPPTFSFPRAYSFPAFYTLQPTLLTRQTQFRKWSALILSYCRHHRLYRLSLIDAADTPLFHNRGLRKRLRLEDVREVMGWMAGEEGGRRVEWIGGGGVGVVAEAGGVG
ncbi:hypothetical protein G7Y79_00037g073280 [Physcia stellaris]|nr:hypothetical protein G7Y79_00037g073280 [Physcia stellaris]